MFASTLFECGDLTETEWSVFLDWHTWILKQCEPDIALDAIIYLRAQPQVLTLLPSRLHSKKVFLNQRSRASFAARLREPRQSSGDDAFRLIVCFPALFAASAPPGQGGGAGNSSGVSGAASLQARVLAPPQEHEVSQAAEHARHSGSSKEK